MIITENIVREVIAIAILRTSKSLGIVDPKENYVPDDALDQIALSIGHKMALDEFVEAYQDWYKFHLEIYKAGKSGNLSGSEHTELSRLMDRRDATRNALLDITA